MILSPRQFTVNRGIWFTIACVLLIDALWIWVREIHVENIADVVFSLAFIIIVASLISFAAYRNHNNRLCIFGNVLNQLACQVIAIGFLSYPCYPYHDTV